MPSFRPHHALFLLLLLLPLSEAGKNIAALLLILSFLWRLRAPDSVRRGWGLSDALLLAWLAACVIVAVHGKLTYGTPIGGLGDWFRMLAVAWIVSRLHLDAPTRRRLLGVFAAALTIAIARGWQDYWSGQTAVLTLTEIGHENHAAIFLLIAWGWLTAEMIAAGRPGLRLLYGAAVPLNLLIALSLLFTQSRAALVGLIAAALLLAWLSGLRRLVSKHPARTGLALGGLVLVLAIFPPPALQKHLDWQQRYDTELSPREKIWNFAAELWRKEPLLGLGLDSFSRFDHQAIRAQVTAAEGDFDPQRYQPYDHPHHLYLTWLVSGGLLLFGAGTAFFAYLLWLLWRTRRRRCDPDAQAVRLAAAAATLSVLLVGLMNTTLHHEHGLLSFILFGLLIARAHSTPPDHFAS